MLLMLLTILVATAGEIPRATTADSTTLYVDPLGTADPNLTPGSTFSINITVSEVEDLFGYQFTLSYNTTVLTATSYESYAPFTYKWGAIINDTGGYLSLIYTMVPPVSQGKGMYGTVPLLKITFSVDAFGVSRLDLHDTKMTKPLEPAGMPHVVKDGSFANILLHDIAITSVTASPKRVEPGELVSIDVIIANKGNFEELLNASVYYSNATRTTLLGDERGVSLGADENTTLSFIWDTTDVANGEYILSANATIDQDYYPTDNVYGEVRVRIGVRRDIAVINVTAEPIEALLGEPMIIRVIVKNLGSFTESLNVSVKYDGTLIRTTAVDYLVTGSIRTADVTWHTEKVAEGYHNITAEAIVSVDDDNTANNIGGLRVKVGMTGSPIILYYWVAGILTMIVGTSSLYKFRARARKSKPM